MERGRKTAGCPSTKKPLALLLGYGTSCGTSIAKALNHDTPMRFSLAVAPIPQERERSEGWLLGYGTMAVG
jgi:hypothetical protein